MTLTKSIRIGPAQRTDARAIARLMDIAGEGIPGWMWSRVCEPGQDPLDIGEARAARAEGGFSFSNAQIARQGADILGMVLGYPITRTPAERPDDVPAPIAPFVELEALSVGTWYINALAVRAERRGQGLGARLMEAAEQTARSDGFDRCSIQVFERNEGAVRLYRRLGYEEIVRSPVRLHPCPPYHRGNVLLLTRRLSPTA